jgi:hypothetical protein
MADVTVIGIGCEYDRLFAGQPPVLPLPDPPGRDDLRDLWEAVAGPLRREAAVIVVVGGWLSEDVLRSVRTVHSLLDTSRVAIHVTELPPLAASVMAALLAALGPRAPSAGVLANAIEDVENELYVLATAGSVARLEHPNVSLLHHARSLVPGKSFGIGLAPEQFVVPLGRTPREIPLTPCDHGLQLLLAASEQGDLDWMVDVVAPALGGVEVRTVSPTVHGAAWWGTSRLVEAVGLPTSIDWLADVVLTGEARPCGWCREPILHAPCPFCGQSPPPERHHDDGPAGNEISGSWVLPT